MKRLLFFLYLSIVCLVSHAQDERKLYDRAYQLAGKHQIDSVFYYIDSLATKFGHEKSYLYFNLSTNPWLHKEARWRELMGKLIKAKHEVEDTLTLHCPQTKDISKVIMPEAKHYDIYADINVKQKLLKVDGTVTVDFHGQSFIDFALWKYSTVESRFYS